MQRHRSNTDLLGATAGAYSGFEGRVVWVTGAASGMGARHAERFAALGACVGCLDVHEDVQAVADGIRREGGAAEAVLADVANWQAVAAGGEELERGLGPVSVVVANAGVIPRGGHAEQVDPGEWERTISINLTGAFHTAKAAIPQVRRAGGGSIVLVASAAGLGAGPGYAAYYASKHGVIGLMRALANELAAEGIRVNAVCPGWVDTPMLDPQAADMGLDREEAARIFASDQLIQRLIEPDEVCDAILWLASDRASMVTGVSLPIDGGLLERRFRA